MPEMIPIDPESDLEDVEGDVDDPPVSHGSRATNGCIASNGINYEQPETEKELVSSGPEQDASPEEVHAL
ncbi:Uu.00g135120.m01.CDS01 [Anthostomella pinea]|uniref:Uu.00g135120.m01.CDS01 n=1 Tax=Anthostomella pinea TaxID=933095 RepID=A0AAI8VQ89_9PEZI|nr:Uu.00g135120.m01.CDS01 [Anthostomella pinea]